MLDPTRLQYPPGPRNFPINTPHSCTYKTHKQNPIPVSKMASSKNIFLPLCILFCISISAIAQQSFRPRALVLPVTKDSTTLQYLAQIQQRTPLVPVNLTVDLGGQSLWVDCERGFSSSTYRPVRCRSAQCNLATRAPACTGNNVCSLTPDNTVTGTATSGDLSQDVVSIRSTDGNNPGRPVSVRNFQFICAPNFLLQGLANGVKGMAGLGRNRIALPSQFAAAFSFHRKFAICLSSSDGVVFFGDGPYGIRPIDASQSLTYTPLLTNPVSTASAFTQGDPSVEYFVGVTAVRVNGNAIPLNTTLLRINRQGFGGTKISTVDPYTVLQTSIYRSVVDAFVKGLPSAIRVAAVRPFEVCYAASSIQTTRVGYAVPSIDLVFQNNNVVWSIPGVNSMVRVNSDVLCLGLVDSGANPRTSIVIGGHQLENNLLQFDLATSRLGFSNSLIVNARTGCFNFNFTSVA